MTDQEIESLRKSIAKAQEALSKELLLPEDASQLRRMIAYYEDKIEGYQKSKEGGAYETEHLVDPVRAPLG